MKGKVEICHVKCHMSNYLILKHFMDCMGEDEILLKFPSNILK